MLAHKLSRYMRVICEGHDVWIITGSMMLVQDSNDYRYDRYIITRTRSRGFRGNMHCKHDYRYSKYIIIRTRSRGFQVDNATNCCRISVRLSTCRRPRLRRVQLIIESLVKCRLGRSNKYCRDAAKMSRRAGVGLLEHGWAPGIAGIAIMYSLGVRSLSQHCTVLAVLA
jgi:hypothetical protein